MQKQHLGGMFLSQNKQINKKGDANFSLDRETPKSGTNKLGELEGQKGAGMNLLSPPPAVNACT